MTTNITTLDKTIFGSTSIFTDVAVYERIDPKQLFNIIHTAKLIELNGTRYENGMGKLYKTEKDLLLNYQYQWNQPLGCFVSNWSLKPYGWGRVLPDEYLSMSVFHRATRHTLCDKYLIDLDIINCHYVIVLDYMKRLNMSCVEIEKYCANTKKYRAAVAKHYGIELDQAKSLFIRLIYGGGLRKWKQDNNIDTSIKDYGMLFKMKKELTEFQNVVVAGNQHIIDDILLSSPYYFHNAYEGKRDKTLMSFWCQSIERYIQEKCIMFLVDKYDLMINNFIPCQDGFMMRKEDYNNDIVNEVNEFIRNNLGYVIDMIDKPFDEKYQIGVPSLSHIYMPFDLTMAEDKQYAQYLIDIGTDYKHMLTTGDNKILTSYVYNGVYWEQGSLHIAEFHQGRMDFLQTWCSKKIQDIMITIRKDPRLIGYVDDKETERIRKEAERKILLERKEAERIRKEAERKILLERKEAERIRKETERESMRKRKNDIKEKNNNIRELIKQNKQYLKETGHTDDIKENEEKINQLKNEIIELTNIPDVIDNDNESIIDDDNESVSTVEAVYNCDDTVIVCKNNNTVFQKQMKSVLLIYSKCQSDIRRLSRNLMRESVAKIFMAMIHQPVIEWNNNPDWFVFQDCVYDLKNDTFIKTKPEDYILMTCGRKYNNFKCNSKEEFDNLVAEARRKLLKFFQGVVAKENYHYLMKYLSSFLRGLNKEEKAHFWLGEGRNSKGTITSLLKDVLGNYWGELNMEYYTNHVKDADRPNQNLYNCRNARVLNSSEVSDSNENGDAVVFISAKFKTITGQDPIYARELGTKNTANFIGGKALFQTNRMPTFTTLKGESLRERIVVVPFPYTFTDDKKKLEENPEKYKQKDSSLKDMFKLPVYVRALTDILFEFYKEYKVEFKITESIQQHTNTYFDGESIQGIIDEHYIETNDKDSGVSLSIIKRDVEMLVGKKMSIRLIKEELTSKKYKVTKSGNDYTLKGFNVKEDEE